MLQTIQIVALLQGFFLLIVLFKNKYKYRKPAFSLKIECINSMLLYTVFLLSYNNKIIAPNTVLETFTKKFENTKSAEWEKQFEMKWEVEFKKDGINYSTNFESDGNWLETESEIQKKGIPETNLYTLNPNFKDFTIEQFELLETVDGKSFEFELEKRGEEIEVV
jgi:hypothetical protein